MRTEAVIGFVLLFGVGAYFLLKSSQPPTAEEQLRSRIFALPGELKFGERRELAKQNDVGAIEGAAAGAQVGLVGGPWGAAIGAGGGLIASAFT